MISYSSLLPQPVMKRRPLIKCLTLGAIASSFPAALAACNKRSVDATNSVKIDSRPRDDGFAAVGTVTDLDREGFILNEAFFTGVLLVIRNPDDASALIAVEPFCTHQGCLVDWEIDVNAFVCPCHDARFNADGSVANGPAQRSLSTLEAIIEQGLVLVKVTM